MAKESKQVTCHALQDFSYAKPGKDGPVNVPVKQGTNLTLSELEAAAWAKRQLVADGKAPVKKK